MPKKLPLTMPQNRNVDEYLHYCLEQYMGLVVEYYEQGDISAAEETSKNIPLALNQMYREMKKNPRLVH